MKTFFLNFEDGLDEKYIRWTREAIQEFIDLFPEYKDNFASEERNFSYQNLDILKAVAERNKKAYERSRRNQNSTEVFDEASFWKMFEKLPNGSYQASFKKQIALATRNGVVDIQKLSRLQSDSVGNGHSANMPILVNVTKQKAGGNIRGISSKMSIDISAGTCANLGYKGDDLEAYFKDIIIHELGHTFNATHEGRQNVVENLGTHCTDKNCLMYEYAYTNESFNRRKKRKEPFCQDCMASMRNYMENTLLFGKANETQTLYVSQNQDEQNSAQNTPSIVDKEAKKVLREIFQPSAAKQNAEYKEDLKAPEYRAEIKHANGSIDKIVATSAHNIALSAEDKDGNAQMPNMQRFRDIVALAKKQGSVIKFGNIKSPDFKALLMLACMEAKPAMQMVGAPELNDEFLQSVQNEKLKTALQIMKNKQQQQPQPQQNTQVPNPTPNPQQQQPAQTPAPQPQQPAPQPQTPTLTPRNNYEKSREIRRRTLEGKEKSGIISKMEKAELDYICAIILKQTELENAKIKYNSVDPRFEEHEQKSGLKTENFYYSSKGRGSCADWKLHLDVVPNHNHPTTQAVSQMLEQLDVTHKIAHGGENGKGMTIYVGSYGDTVRLAKEINARFGKEIETSPCYVDQALQEHYFNPKVSGRFWMQHVFSIQYPNSSIAGICPASESINRELDGTEGEEKIFNLAQKNGIISAEDKFSEKSYTHFCFLSGDFHKVYLFRNIEAYCSHKLYEKELGEFYCGKNADKFEKDFFGDKIPEKGTPERANWDKVAGEYVSFIENTHPNIIQMMKQEAQKYHSVDFSKLPPMPQNTQVRGGGRSA